jgi:hypothetical protein
LSTLFAVKEFTGYVSRRRIGIFVLRLDLTRPLPKVLLVGLLQESDGVNNLAVEDLIYVTCQPLKSTAFHL